MKSLVFKTLRFKISFFIIILLLVTTFLFTLITVPSMNRYVLNEIIKRTESLSKSVAAIAPYSILSGDLLGTDNVNWKIKEANNDVEYAPITNNESKILVHTDFTKVGEWFQEPFGKTIRETRDGTRIYEPRNGGDSLEIHTPITFKNRKIGTVVIGINKSLMSEARAETIKRVIAGLAVVMLLGIGCIIVLSSFVTRPIQELSKGVDELKMGKKAKLRIYSNDELGKLTESFNRMTELTLRQQDRLSAYAQELEESYVSTVKVLTAAIDARDPYTLGHSMRVAKLSIKVGEAIGMSGQELEDLEMASLFHDVGKLRTPDYVLLKDGPLDPTEQREISSHCEYGAAILSRASSLQKYIPAVRHHHEWFNGEGYPDGLRGDDIPLHAAIIAIADAFDAMTSMRPYKNPFSRDEAVHELNQCAGKQFNPWLVEVFQTTLVANPVLADEFSGRCNS